MESGGIREAMGTEDMDCLSQRGMGAEAEANDEGVLWWWQGIVVFFGVEAIVGDSQLTKSTVEQWSSEEDKMNISVGD